MSSNNTIESTKQKAIEEIKLLYPIIAGEIELRLEEFRQVGKLGTDEDIFFELVFCLLTPQSRARACWASVENLVKRNLLLEGNRDHLLEEMDRVRFKYKKADYILKARELFSVDGKISIVSQIIHIEDAKSAREWLVQNVMGIGYKEASHFLRNIGLGEDLAILDRHILKNLRRFGVIEDIPGSISRKKYLEIEGQMHKFADMIGIPMGHLDLLLWYKEAGEVFK